MSYIKLREVIRSLKISSQIKKNLEGRKKKTGDGALDIFSSFIYLE